MRDTLQAGKAEIQSRSTEQAAAAVLLSGCCERRGGGRGEEEARPGLAGARRHARAFRPRPLYAQAVLSAPRPRESNQQCTLSRPSQGEALASHGTASSDRGGLGGVCARDPSGTPYLFPHPMLLLQPPFPPRPPPTGGEPLKAPRYSGLSGPYQKLRARGEWGRGQRGWGGVLV